MIDLETIVSIIAAMTFVWLVYWLGLIACSLPIALARLNHPLDQLRHIASLAISVKPEAQAWLGPALKPLQHSTIRPCAATMVLNVTRLFLRGQTALANDRKNCWLRTCAGDWERHLALPNIATAAGMLYTVLGGLFAFSHIGESEDPFSAFGSLALAMLTTIGGLIISMAANHVLDVYQRRLILLESTTEEVITSLLERETSVPRKQKTNRAKKKPETAIQTMSSVVDQPASEPANRLQSDSQPITQPTDSSVNGYQDTEGQPCVRS